MADRLREYLDYHRVAMEMGDIDPQIPALLYICDRFELNSEQRYWMAWLYAANGDPCTSFFVFNEFPDADQVNMSRLRRWWVKHRRHLIFHADRIWAKSADQFCPMVANYRKVWAGQTQESWFGECRRDTPRDSYDAAYKHAGRLYQFGRFSLFLYLEAVHLFTGFPLEPTGLDLANSETCRNGLCYAYGLDQLVTGTGTGQKTLSPLILKGLDGYFHDLVARVKAEDVPGCRVSTMWNVETTLCTYKKYLFGKRWHGFYLDKQYEHIMAYQRNVPRGVCWQVMWDHRREQIDHAFLKEYQRKSLKKA